MIGHIESEKNEKKIDYEKIFFFITIAILRLHRPFFSCAQHH